MIATGVTPRQLPGADLAGVHLLRTLDDALTLRVHLLARPKVAVVGGGFLGVTSVVAGISSAGRLAAKYRTVSLPSASQYDTAPRSAW